MQRILEDAPNPQFARKNWIDLTGAWRFSYDDDDIGLQAGWWRSELPNAQEIQVPYPPESTLSGIADSSFHPVLWYQRELLPPDVDAGELTLVHFGAVDYAATVWIEDVLVGMHEGGSSPFTVCIRTDWLRSLNTRLMTVRVFDSPTDLEQPRGKQSWTNEPSGIFYKRTSGIWQPVWQESVPATYLLQHQVTFDPENRSLDVSVELNRAPEEGDEISVSLITPDGDRSARIAADSRVASLTLDLASFQNEWLWSPNAPTLLPLTIELSSGDCVHSYVGLRTLELNQGGYQINGTPVWLRMVLHQGYWPESHLAAPSADAIRKEIELTLELGFNGARTHQKAEDPRYLYLADKHGLLLWGEIGAAYSWSDRAINRLVNEWTEIVRRDRNHPSIIGWTPFNESWGVGDVASQESQQEAVRAVVHLTRSLDGTRPVIGNDGWEHVVTDILTIHDYEWDGRELNSRYGDHRSNQEIADTYDVAQKSLLATEIRDLDRLPRMITEYGGVSFAPATTEEWYGYGKVSNAEEFEKKYRELTKALHAIKTLIGVCYTQLTDTEQETNGLLTDQREPKIAMDSLRAITRGEPAR